MSVHLNFPVRRLFAGRRAVLLLLLLSACIVPAAPPPTLEAVEPAQGFNGAATEVVIRGEGFRVAITADVSGKPRARADFRAQLVGVPGTMPLVDVRFLSAFELQATVPAGLPAGMYDLRVTTPEGAQGELSAAFHVSDRLPPRIDAIVPARGPDHGGDIVTIQGEGFSEGTTVRLGTAELRDVTRIDAQTLTGTTPPGWGWVDVVVTTDSGDVVLERGYFFKPPPVVTLVIPAFGLEEGGLPVEVTGFAFVPDLTLTFGTEPLQQLEWRDSRTAVGVVPPGTGTVDVILDSSLGSDILPRGFTYLPRIEIHEVQPPFGPVEGGLEVRVVGAGFVQGTQVRFGGQPLADVVIESREVLRGAIPAGEGRVPVEVENPVSQATWAGEFEYVRTRDCAPEELDRDGDGHNALPCGGADCRDLDSKIHPGAQEICNARDDDCDGIIDEGCDDDLDGWCDAGMPVDLDAGSCWRGTGDCDDDDPRTFPGASERCDGKDNACDGGIDEGCDDDGDGYCDAAMPAEPGACELGIGDCADDDPERHPGRVERCDGRDENCNGEVDDGFDVGGACEASGVCGGGVWECDGAGAAVCSTAIAGSAFAGVSELCNGLDDDCDGEVDEDFDVGEACTGKGACGAGVLECADEVSVRCSSAPGGSADRSRPELCNGIDDDCDPSTPDGVADSRLGAACDGSDADLCADDRYMGCEDGELVCSDGPDEVERCDGVDNDCDPTTPDGAGDTRLGRPCDGDDADLCEDDVFEACVDGVMRCSAGEANVEICDGVDNDCDPTTADGVADPQLDEACDGSDSDACEDDVWVGCEGGALVCSAGEDTLELCDGVDNDCNPDTPDGADEVAQGIACDGPDPDLCEDDVYDSCVDGELRCSDGEGALEVCDGVDNDCDPATPDGAEDPRLGMACDGSDSDACEDDVWVGCEDGALLCSGGDDTLELCDGVDNDCDPDTADGVDEVAMGIACDGSDTDLCEDDLFDRCVDGALVCSDGEDDLELCDGEDNDCNPDTADGSEDPGLGTPCDGDDSDLCADDLYVGCDAGALVCASGEANPELCDGVDNDCDPQTPDGLQDPAVGQACDGSDADLCLDDLSLCEAGRVICAGGESNLELCDGADNDCDPATPDGAGDPRVGLPCDGPDSDACQDDLSVCDGGALACSRGEDDLELCDGADNDCDPQTADGAEDPRLGDACDGADNDHCLDDVFVGCDGGTLTCADGDDNVELCDREDNDCDPSTPDGAMDPALGTPCDGADSDLCDDDVYEACVDGVLLCSLGEDELDLCDGEDNDCDPLSADGDEDGLIGESCEGPDSDLCEDDIFSACVAGELICSFGDDTLDVCDGLDNDCDPASEDGSEDPGLGGACDGDDSDLCADDIFSACVAGELICSLGDDTLDVCDGLDNDCDPGTADGVGDSRLGSACDGADSDLCEDDVFDGCADGVLLCTVGADDADLCDGVDNDCDPDSEDGSEDPRLGSACDGADADLCEDDLIVGCAFGEPVCSAGSDNPDVCDGEDNDCDPSSADGSADPALGAACDGADSDLCEDDVFEACVGGELQCSLGADAVEVCDGVDNDCDTNTPDGAADPALGSACDGADSDLCEDDVFDGCAAGELTCSLGDDTLDLCDDEDNDCNPSTADGAGDPRLGTACDGADADLCEDDSYEACVGGTMRCSDGADNAELCDGVDNDCNPATADGADEALMGQSCDGDDADLCEDDVYDRCVAYALDPLLDPYAEPFGGGPDLRYQLRNVSIAGAGNHVEAANGGTFEVSLELSYSCASCVDGTVNQVIVGLEGDAEAQACIYSGARDSGGWLPVNFQVEVPDVAGRYHLRARYAQDEQCPVHADWWTTDSPDGPDASHSIGAIVIGPIGMQCSAGQDNVELCDGADNDCDGDTDEAGVCEEEAGCARRVELRFDNAGRAAISQAPVPVILTPDRIEYARTGPDDFRFRGDDGAVLPHEIESWEPGDESVIWVRVQQIDADSASDGIRLYYDCSDTAPERATEVWDSFSAVWHMDDSLADSTGQGATGVNNGTLGRGGRLARARKFDVGQDIDVGATQSTMISGDLTISTWFRLDELRTSNWENVIVSRSARGLNSSRNTQYWLHLNGDGTPGIYWEYGFRTGVYVEATQSAGFATRRWYHFAVTRDSTAQEVRFYVDGSPLGDAVSYNRNPTGGSATHAYIGVDACCLGNDNWRFYGRIDELRLSDQVRDGDFVELEHRSGDDALFIYGAPADNF